MNEIDWRGYLPGVDGLRAISVIAVVLFHAGSSKFGGGFVGVDIFFVVSGFLITRLIVDEVERTGAFRFSEFYARRARRLFPALFVVLILTFVAAVCFFAPDDFERFGEELFSALVSLSNIHFWRASGYFDVASQYKPLLHTWSLAVEEQFYLVWPFAVVALFRAGGKVAVLIGLALAGAISLAANAWMLSPVHTEALNHLNGSLGAAFSDGATAIFYLTPFRIFEFAIGASLLWLPVPKSNGAREAMMGVGLLLVGISVHQYLPSMAFPSSNALVPCLGASLIILGCDARFSGAVVRNQIAVLIGRISYSVYLVHWPLMALYRYWRVNPLSFGERYALVAASFVLGHVLYSVVETPIRQRRVFASLTQPGVGFVCAMLTIGMLVSASSVQADNGWQWRLSADARNFDNANLSGIAGRIGCTIYCESGDSSGPKVLLVGDSHSDQYSRALKRVAGDRYHFYQVYSPSCFFGKTMTSWPNASLGPGCVDANAKLHDLLASTQFDAIIVSERWPGYRDILVQNGQHLTINDLDVLYPKMLTDIQDLYAGFKGKVIIVGHAPNTNTLCYARPQFFSTPCPSIPLFEHTAFARDYEQFAKTTSLNVSFVNPVEDICPDGQCKIVDSRGRLLYSDAIHLSIYGASMVVPQIVADLPGRDDGGIATDSLKASEAENPSTLH